MTKRGWTGLLATRIGRRGAALLFFAVLDAFYCYGLLTVPQPMPPFYAWMAEVAPLPVWAAGWGVVGAVCLLFSFRTYDTPAFIAAVALKVCWGMISFFGWINGSVDRGYISTAIWLAFAAFVYLIAGGIPPAVRPAESRWTWTRS